MTNFFKKISEEISYLWDLFCEKYAEMTVYTILYLWIGFVILY